MYIFLSWFLTTLLWDYLPCRCYQSPHSQPLTLLAFVTYNTKSGRKSLVQFHTWWKHINIIATITNFMMQLHNHMITTLHFSLLEYSPELWLQYGSNSTDNCFSVLPQSAIYSCSYRTSRFLESVLTTQSTTTTHHISQDFLPFSLSGLTHRGFTSPVCLAIIASSLHAIIATCVLASITCSELCRRASVHAHMQLSHVYRWCFARDKMYQALPRLRRESLGCGYVNFNLYSIHNIS